jgi:hypothetical protein
MPRQHTAERREQGPISGREPRPSDLTLQHAKLVAQQQDLDLSSASQAYSSACGS